MKIRFEVEVGEAEGGGWDYQVKLTEPRPLTMAGTVRRYVDAYQSVIRDMAYQFGRLMPHEEVAREVRDG